MSFADSLHHASWRGVPFAVEEGATRVGRRKVAHEYPYRDTAWFEDQGRRPREFRLRGFLVGHSAIYGGGDVHGQQRRMQSAAEASGTGILVHPSRGRITCDLLDLVFVERWDEGDVIEVQFTFAQGGQKSFPAALGALGDLLGKAAGLADAAGLGSFSTALLGPLQQGLSTVTQLTETAGQWVDRIEGLARDATSLYGTVSQLGGADFGRYFNGRNSGFLAGLSSPYAGAASVTDLIDLGSSKRAAISDAAGGIFDAIDRIGLGGSASDVASAAQKTVAALQASTANPADGVRLMSSLANFTPIGAATRSPAGEAFSALFGQAAATGVARAAAAYAPSSADDAHAVRERALGPIDTVITRAGQASDDGVFQAFRGLRRAVVEDLGARGGSLARLTEVVAAQPLPSVVLAQQRYGDAARAAGLVTQADPVHPWFMPLTFKALAD